MVSAYFQDCRYCGQRIQLRPLPGGQWAAWEGSGVHDCRGQAAASAASAPTAEPEAPPEPPDVEADAADTEEAAEEPTPSTINRPRAVFGPLPQRVEVSRYEATAQPPYGEQSRTGVGSNSASAYDAGAVGVAGGSTEAVVVERMSADLVPARPYFEWQPPRRRRRRGAVGFALLTGAAALVACAYLALVGINVWVTGSAWAALPDNAHWYCWSSGIPMPHEITGSTDERLCTEDDVRDIRNVLWPRVLPDPWR